MAARTPDEPLVTLDEIRAAATRLAGIALRTPLLPLAEPAAGGALLYLKPENLQPIGAFKIRGAYHAIAGLDAARRARGVVTHSSGNHAQGVARAARLLGTRAVIVMPDDAPPVKVAAVRADGAEIVMVGPPSDERAERARQLARERGLTLIPPYDDRSVIAGQGTVGLEIVDQVAELGHDGPLCVYVPIGGGGLASGVATAVKSLRPEARVLGVEPALAADARDSLEQGRVVHWTAQQTARTSADGMRAQALGSLPFRHLQRHLDGVVTVEEVEIHRAMARVARLARLVVEPSGATALAAALFGERPSDRDEVRVVVVSGGNVEPARYLELLAAGIAAGG